MATDIQVDPGVPREVAAVAMPLLVAQLPRVPTWCHVLTLGWEDVTAHPQGDGRQRIASMAANVEYRRALLTLGPPWLSLTDERRAETVAHEVTHIVLQPMTDAYTALIEPLREENAVLYTAYCERWRLAWEGAVCDLTAMRTERP